MRQRILAVAACLAVATPAAASSSDVLRDARDGHLDRRYSPTEIAGALKQTRGVVGQTAVVATIWAQVEVDLLGERTRVVTQEVPARTSVGGVKTSKERPSNTPRRQAELGLPDFAAPLTRTPATGLPVFVVVLGGLAGALLVSGATVMAARRLRSARG